MYRWWEVHRRRGLRIGRVLTGELGSGRMRGTFEWAADIMPVYESDKVVVRFRTDDAGKNWLKEIARAKEPPKEAGKT